MMLSILVSGNAKASPQEFKFAVEHDHLIRSCKGELVINQEGVEYRTKNKEHLRKWPYTDIKMIKLASPKDIKVYTYESSWMNVGRDETFEFKVIQGQATKELSDFLLARIARPLATTFVATEEKGRYEIPVRHNHRVSSCQGVLKVYPDKLIYESSKQENSRYWRWADIQSISRTGPYQFSVTTYEPKLGGPKLYNFDLKEQMGEAIYEYLWARVYKVTYPKTFEVKQ
jgi:hypothetical protein